MTWESGISFFLAVLIFGVTPGPGVFAILARALVCGARSCFWLALGMTVSDMLYLIAACIGLAALATRAPSKPPQQRGKPGVQSRAGASHPRVHSRHVAAYAFQHPPGFT